MIAKNFKFILLFSLVIFLGCSSSLAANTSETSNNVKVADIYLKSSSTTNISSPKILAAGGDVKPTKLSQTTIWSASKSVKNYAEKYGKLPNYVTISSAKYSMPEFLHLVSKSIAYKCLKSTNTVKIEYNAKNPSKPTGNSIKSTISKANYYDIAKRTCLYVEKYDQAPNYVSSKYGKLQYQTLIYGLSKIGAYIGTYKKLPSSLSLNIKSSNSINKNIPKYTRTTATNINNNGNAGTNSNSDTDGNTNTNSNSGTNNLNKNKNAIWVHSGSMTSINLDTLVNNGIGNIFIHEDIFKSKTAALNWISTATKKGINIHVWFTCFYDTSAKKWINPIDTSKKTFNQAYFNTIINRAKEYVSYTGVAGIHLDYLRYPGTANNYYYSDSINGASAITEFAKQLSTAVKSMKSNIIISAAVMPETSSNAKYYGQDCSQLGKYIDVIVPMIYKGNYGKTSTWIKSTTEWFVKNSGGAEIWGGLQTYNSDNDITKLSASSLSTDCKAIMNGGAAGIALFRWGLINFFNLLTL